MFPIDVEPFYKDVGERIKTERLKRNMTQETLGNYLELKRTSIINLEKGRHHPSIYQLMQIAHLFEVDFNTFLPAINARPKQSAKKIAQNLDHIITDQDKVDKSTRAAVLNFLTAINQE